MGIETTGKLHTIFETKQVSERFTKREFVVELADNPKYPQLGAVPAQRRSLRAARRMRVGDEVRIEFSCAAASGAARNGEVKYFNSLDVWKIEPLRAGRGDEDPRDMDMPPRMDEPVGPAPDDLPF